MDSSNQIETGNQDPTTLIYDLTKENKENMTIDYRHSNYKKILIPLPELTNKNVAVKQDFRLGKGGIFWDNSFFLTKYLIEKIFPQKDIKHIIEIGAGTALPSIASLIKGYHVVVTDIPKLMPFVNDIINMNKDLYSKNSKSEVVQLSWEKKEDIENAKKLVENGTYDVIIGSEVIYLDDLFDDLIYTMRELSNEKTIILFSYKVRLQSMVDEFIEKVSKYFELIDIDYEVKNQLYVKPEKMKMLQMKKKKI